MKLISVLLASLLAALTVSAQGRRSVVIEDPAFSTGKEFYEKGDYSKAIYPLEQEVTHSPDNTVAITYLASCYYHTGRFEQALEKFRPLLKNNVPLETYLYYEAGMAAVNVESWKESEKIFNVLRQNAKTERMKHIADYMLYYAQQAPVLRAQPPTMPAPVALPAPVNSGNGDYLPMLDATGTKLYFTSKRPGGFSADIHSKNTDEDLYFTQYKNEQWTEPSLLPAPLNTVGNDGAASFSADGQLMVFGACNRQDGVGSCDLYFSVLEGDQWSIPKNMGNVVNSEAWDAQSTLSADGSRIIFSSERPGGYGNEDLYWIERNTFGEWGVAVNLGSVINTPLSELAPFLSQDGKTLYFSSNGHPGFGSADIFKSVFENGKWSIPVNVGKPLNTSGDDRYFTIGGNNEKGYFSTQRDGVNTLYEIEIPESMRPQPTTLITGTVTNAKTNSPVEAFVLVEDMRTGELIAMNKSNAVTGQYLVVLPSGRTYSVSASKESFFFYSNRFDVPRTSVFTQVKKDITLQPIEKGAKVILNNIFFETGKANLTDESRLELQKAIDLMRHNSSMMVEVGGHTDNVGDDAANMRLSHDRAKSVRDYLVRGGIDPGRIQAKGYGELNPVADNTSEEGRQANRRTEFVILEF